MNAEYQMYRSFNMYETNGARYHAHLHTHCEFMYVLKGTVSATIDGEDWTAKENDVIAVLPHQIHSFDSKFDGSERVCILMISPVYLKGFADKINDNVLTEPVISLSGSESRLVRSIFEYIFAECPIEIENNVHERIRRDILDRSQSVKNLVLAYITLIFEKGHWKKKTSSAPDNARRILEYCMEHYCEDISVAGIADGLSINPHTVTRIFSTVFKQNFRTHINEMRLSTVTDMLIETELPVTEIAFKCGFETLRTFNRIFLMKYGMSPSEFRKTSKVRSE